MQQLAITASTIRRNERSLELVEARFDVGLGNELELAPARRTLAEARAQLPQAEIGPRAACDALAALLGKHPGTMLHLLDPEMIGAPNAKGVLTIQPVISSHNDLISKDFPPKCNRLPPTRDWLGLPPQPTFGLEAALAHRIQWCGNFAFPHRRLVERDFDRGHPLVGRRTPKAGIKSRWSGF